MYSYRHVTKLIGFTGIIIFILKKNLNGNDSN
jgi:hypothetical protein